MAQLIHGDCLEVMKDMPDNSVDLVVTSPPYDNLRDYGNDFKGWGEHIWKPCLDDIKRLLKDGGVCVWVVGDATINGSETGTSFKQALYAKEIGLNLHDTMIYAKQSMPNSAKRYEQLFEYMFIFSKCKPKTFNPIMEKSRYAGFKTSGTGQTTDGKIIRHEPRTIKDEKKANNVWFYLVGNGGRSCSDKIAHQHPAIFPEKLAEDHIISWSNKNDTVMDPFMGSGTVGLECKKLNRNFIGIELDADYFKLASDRIAKPVEQPLF
jgi:site-specific DNA-methyltransferase (adenine-specific)